MPFLAALPAPSATLWRRSDYPGDEQPFPPKSLYSGDRLTFQPWKQIVKERLQTNFSAAAVLKKWPSKNNERANDVRWPIPYSVFDGTLDECITKFLALPAGQRHLYEIHTAPQGDLVPKVISAELAVEIARLRDFLR